MSEPKSTKKTARPRKIVQPKGRGALYAGGVPGNKGGGRPPDEFKAKMAELASSDEALDYLARCLRGDEGPKAAISAQKYAADRGYGKPEQPITVAGDDKRPLTIRVVHE